MERTTALSWRVCRVRQNRNIFASHSADQHALNRRFPLISRSYASGGEVAETKVAMFVRHNRVEQSMRIQSRLNRFQTTQNWFARAETGASTREDCADFFASNQVTQECDVDATDLIMVIE